MTPKILKESIPIMSEQYNIDEFVVPKPSELNNQRYDKLNVDISNQGRNYTIRGDETDQGR